MATTKTEAFLERLMASDIGRRILAEAQAEEVNTEERQSKAGHLAALRAGRAGFMEAIRAEVAEAEGRLKAAREELKEAMANHNTVLSTTYGKQWAYDEDIRRAEAFLSASAPGPLKRALETAEAKLERLRSARVERVSFPDIPSGVRLSESDRPTIDAVEERARELAEATRQIENIKAEILGGQS